MSQFRTRIAVSPLKRDLEAAANLPTIDAMIAARRPTEPMHCLRPATIEADARAFVDGFPGTVLYAVKCNPEPAVLRAIWDGGVRHFDCASAPEVALVRQMFPSSHIHFMHPVKSRPAIREAYFRHGVRDFVLDCDDELDKILLETADSETGPASDLGLFVRLALPANDAAQYDLSGKFGAAPEAAAELLRRMRGLAGRIGISFHVGSQCMDPLVWRHAIQLAGNVIAESRVDVDIMDVGGGFPAHYPDIAPPPLGAFFAEIEASFEALDLAGTTLWAEPGRALVAAGSSVVVQVQLRRGRDLYINDGVYGSLSDAGAPGFRFPARRIASADRARGADELGFALFGPTCDRADHMRGPFMLPDDIDEGDWIEIGQLGAYGACLRTAFNGFDRAILVAVCDRPMLGHEDQPALSLAA